MHILVVEDDTGLARQIASTLTEAGHDPIVVHDGEKALDKTKATPFDLIVLDIILPGMDGFEVLAASACATSCQSRADVDRTRRSEATVLPDCNSARTITCQSHLQWGNWWHA